jgi:hypothetical protein
VRRIASNSDPLSSDFFESRAEVALSSNAREQQLIGRVCSSAPCGAVRWECAFGLTGCSASFRDCARSAKWLQPGALFTRWNPDRHRRMLRDALAQASFDRSKVG